MYIYNISVLVHIFSRHTPLQFNQTQSATAYIVSMCHYINQSKQT